VARTPYQLTSLVTSGCSFVLIVGAGFEQWCRPRRRCPRASRGGTSCCPSCCRASALRRVGSRRWPGRMRMTAAVTGDDTADAVSAVQGLAEGARHHPRSPRPLAAVHQRRHRRAGSLSTVTSATSLLTPVPNKGLWLRERVGGGSHDEPAASQGLVEDGQERMRAGR